MKKTFYEKRGRRYVPVKEYDPQLFDSYPRGTHLVVCHPGSTSYRHDIDPDLAPMIAAGLFAKEEINRALIKASEMRPSKTPITERQQRAWRELADSFGDELATLHADCINDISEAGVKAMMTEAAKLLENEAVRRAYDHFMLMCKLVKDSEK